MDLGTKPNQPKSANSILRLAAMCSHVPNKGEQMVRYYGYYSNVSRGKRQKTGDDAAMAYILKPPLPDKTFRKSWARLIQKIYEVDPLVCPACRGEMRVIAVIEEQDVIRKILTHLGLWLINAQPRPVAHAPPDLAVAPFDDWQAPSAYDYLTDPLYPGEV